MPVYLSSIEAYFAAADQPSYRLLTEQELDLCDRLDHPEEGDPQEIAVPSSPEQVKRLGDSLSAFSSLSSKEEFVRQIRSA